MKPESLHGKSLLAPLPEAHLARRTGTEARALGSQRARYSAMAQKDASLHKLLLQVVKTGER